MGSSGLKFGQHYDLLLSTGIVQGVHASAYKPTAVYAQGQAYQHLQPEMKRATSALLRAVSGRPNANPTEYRLL